MTPVETANVIREMIRHEDELLVNRTNWLITLQGLLFAALAFSWEKSFAITVLFVLLGIVFSILFVRYLNFADLAIAKLLRWWEAHSDGYNGPPVIGLEDQDTTAIDLKIIPWKLIPYLFVVSWLFVLVVKLLER